MFDSHTDIKIKTQKTIKEHRPIKGLMPEGLTAEESSSSEGSDDEETKIRKAKEKKEAEEAKLIAERAGKKTTKAELETM